MTKQSKTATNLESIIPVASNVQKIPGTSIVFPEVNSLHELATFKRPQVGILKPATGREANKILMEDGAFDLNGFSVPKLGILIENNPKFVRDMFFTGLGKILGDDTASEKHDKVSAIQAEFRAWNAGFQTMAAWEKSKRQATIAATGKPAKLQYSQMQVSAALRDTLGPDDTFATFFATLDDDQFLVIMESLDDLDPTESKAVKDAINYLQAKTLAELESKAEKEKADRLAKARELMAKAKANKG